jgi:hypothetical protein
MQSDGLASFDTVLSEAKEEGLLQARAPLGFEVELDAPYVMHPTNLSTSGC